MCHMCLCGDQRFQTEITQLKKNGMERKNFLKQGIFGLTTILAGSSLTGDNKQTVFGEEQECEAYPRETRGPFPTKTPAEMIKANITSDRVGIPLLINLIIVNKNNNCRPLPGASVDVWHCDKDGNYSEYGGHPMQRNDFRTAHFLRGRQVSDENGKVSFLSIYPGWYQGRAPHIHFEVFDKSGTSLLVSQVAFPDDISDKVYSSSHYSPRGHADTSNSKDNLFADSLSEQIAIVTGNLTDGFTMTKTVVVRS